MAIDADRVQKPIRKLRKLLKDLPRRSSAKAIHDLRTNARKFEATVEGVKQAEDAKPMLPRSLDRVRKRSGKIRDLDVLTANVLTLQSGGDLDCLVRLVETLGGKRAE